MTKHEGVHPFHIYFLRTLYFLMFAFVGTQSWLVVLRHHGPWDPMRAAAWCMFASYSLLSGIGIFRPLKMLPIVLFMLVYKTLWLAVVAYPLWAAGTLAGSPAAEMARVFRWVPIAYVAMPWGYLFRTYLGRPGSGAAAIHAPLPASK